MENIDLRSYYKMSPEQTGVFVTNVIPGAPTDGIIRTGDFLLSLDDFPIANDGTVEFRTNERTWPSYVVQKRQIGEKITANILRKGEVLSVKIVLYSSINDHWLVPMEEYDTIHILYLWRVCFLTRKQKLFAEMG